MRWTNTVSLCQILQSAAIAWHFIYVNKLFKNIYNKSIYVSLLFTNWIAHTSLQRRALVELYMLILRMLRSEIICTVEKMNKFSQ